MRNIAKFQSFYVAHIRTMLHGYVISSSVTEAFKFELFSEKKHRERERKREKHRERDQDRQKRKNKVYNERVKKEKTK